MTAEAIKEKYSRAAENYLGLKSKEEKHLLVLSLLRLFSFLGGVVLIWFGFLFNISVGLLLLFLVILLFLYLLKLYSYHSDKKLFFNNLSVINSNESAAMSGDLSGFVAGHEYQDIAHDFSYDVDLFGNDSLFQYLNRTVTGYGRDILAGWLSDPYVLAPDLTIRQETIKELAAKLNWRQVFMATGMKKSLEKGEILGLLSWLNERSKIQSSLISRIAIYLLPSAALLSLILVLTGLLPYTVFTGLFLLNLFYIATGLKNTNRTHNILSRKYNYLRSIDEMLVLFDNEPFNSKELIRIKENISGKNESAVAALKQLSRLIQAFDTRLNIIVGFALNGMLLWDFHSIYRLEKWKERNKNRFPQWLEMVGSIDAYISLGNYAFNNPEFAYPSVSDNTEVFSAISLGHPLIHESKRICNDFEINRPGIICIISGANMAGKSTFLRTVAVNYILAMCGTPVCAASMSFTPFRLFTSMRTTDSLSHNESYFYAELKRLKSLKSIVENGVPVYFILDEILKGTNSADKSLGSKLFLKSLAELCATGLIATHDTSLGEMEKECPGKIINKCFEVDIDGELISFDYKLRDGITHKMNAAILMRQMGILR
jgi:DNA mismatch repair ATPase MutS